MLKQLMIAKKIEQRKAGLNELLEQEKALQTREAELETALEEAQTDEEIAVVEENTEKFESDKAELKEKKSKLEGEIAALEGELEELNSKEPKITERTDNDMIETRKKYFAGMTREAMEQLVNREEVKELLTRTRELANQQRGVTGGDLLIPEVMLGLLRDNLSETSKLLSKVNYKPLKGTARMNITGTVPEAVWTEMVGALNELEISFNQVEVDGYKVGGFVAIPNSTLKDSDINLAAEILSQLSKAIGTALDKAILYGTGTKQPLGIVPRLAQTTEPAGYPANAPAWKDLHTSNVKVVAGASASLTGAELIGGIIDAFGATKNNYSDGRKFFAMNSQTHAKLTSTLLNFNAAGALVSGMNNTMPVIGGDIVILDFMSDNDIVAGYGDLYLLAEREGTTLASSEHVKFIEDVTVFKGLARYDGLPVIAEGFVSMHIAYGTTGATSKIFPADIANPVLGELTITSAVGTNKDETDLAMTGGQASGTFFGYVIGDKAKAVKYGEYHTGYTPVTFTAGAATVAVGAANNNKIITVVEFYYGIAIAVGSKKLVVKTS